MMDSYITVAGPSRNEIQINKSRFIGFVSPCNEEEEALSLLRKTREEHRAARHHCYAYIIGENSGIIRYSDDGEPGGTAGLPILEQLRSRKIVNCCLIVTRYFGGILLGTGGLVRAYTQCAKSVLDSAGSGCMELTGDSYCSLPYSFWDKYRYTADQLPVRTEKITYGSSVTFHLLARIKDQESMIARLQDATARKLNVENSEQYYSAWPVQE